MNIGSDIARLGAQAAGNAVHKANEQKKYLNAGGETSEIHAVGRGSDAFSKKLSDVFRRGNSNLIHELNDLSDSDKAEIAANAYFQMQGRVYQAMKREEDDIAKFSALTEEKSRLTNMLAEQSDAQKTIRKRCSRTCRSASTNSSLPSAGTGKKTQLRKL